MSDLIIEDTVDQEDEGSLLRVQDQEDDLQNLTAINEETQNPGATKNHKLSQCFKHHNPKIKEQRSCIFIDYNNSKCAFPYSDYIIMLITCFFLTVKLQRSVL